MGPATGLTCPHSLVADGPLEADALLALKEALRVDLGLDRLELREAVRAPDVLLHRRLVDGIRGGDGRGLDGRLPLVRRYVRTSPLPSPPRCAVVLPCTLDADNV